jgi:hypothetical protein
MAGALSALAAMLARIGRRMRRPAAEGGSRVTRRSTSTWPATTG